MIGTIALVYITYGWIVYTGFGHEKNLDNSFNPSTNFIPDGWFKYIILVLYCFNLFFSYPLVLFPAHTIIESYLYSKMEASKKRTWYKNITRSLLVAFTVGLTVGIGPKIGKFVSILGSLTCTPIAFTWPALFHYKLVAKNKT